MFPLTDINLYF